MPAQLSRRTAIKGLVFATTARGAQAGQKSPSPAIRDVINLDAEHQIIDNFGASDCWSMQKIGAWSLRARNRVADLLFSQTVGIGLSCWRFNIGGGINSQITNAWRTAETFETAEGNTIGRDRPMSAGFWLQPSPETSRNSWCSLTARRGV